VKIVVKILGRMKGGITISTIAHAAILLWALVVFAVKPFSVPPAESMPVDIISIADFSQMMAGAKNAPKKDAPKPLVEKIAEHKPAEDVTAKVAEKELTTASTPKEAPPEAKPPEPKPKAAEAKKEPEKKPDLESLQKADKKDEKKEPKKEEVRLPPKKPEPKKEIVEKKPSQEQPKFDADRIAALLDKRQPQRLAAAGNVLSAAPSLGTANGSAPKLSMSEIDALRARIQQCWNPPAGAADARDLIVEIRIRFNQDGSLAAQPTVSNRGSSTYFQVASESALRAVVRCAPYTFLPAAKYDAWKDVEVTFDPRDMYRG
jgi:chemotaxis protein histidine kinase CheA